MSKDQLPAAVRIRNKPINNNSPMHPNPFNIQNQIALVTGASKGIGRGLALSLAMAGAKVALTARDLPELKTLQQEIEQAGGEAHAFPGDISNLAEIKTIFAAVQRHYGRLDILVNNAGLGANHDAVDVTEADWDGMMNVNAKALFFCCQAAAKIMLPQGHGRIINMSSQASVVGIPRHAVYCASKGAVNQLTKVLALEWSARGVTVNAVGPTFIYTPGTAERLDQPEFRQSVLSRIPANKIGTIDDVAGAVLYLASPAAALVTGTLLLVDGGWTAQ
jgi:NAD(P)-dependent dehydrogenase (short-subunit alcohol dehydrogenase family)